MTYIDAVVCAVPSANKEAFLAHARAIDPIFIEYGALKCVETWGDDVPEGKLTDFPRAVQAKDGEVVTLSWIVWPDKATRDAGWAKVMEDPRMKEAEMPYDGKRMIYGGFQQILEI